MRVMKRLFALLLLAGQLSQVPAAVACTLLEQKPSSACEVMDVGGPALTAAQDHHQAPCDLVGACAAPVAVVLPSGPSQFAADLASLASPAVSNLYLGFDAQPIPPPPQA